LLTCQKLGNWLGAKNDGFGEHVEKIDNLQAQCRDEQVGSSPSGFAWVHGMPNEVLGVIGEAWNLTPKQVTDREMRHAEMLGFA